MAVYTDVSFEELEGLLAGYDVGMPLSFKGIAEGVENSNFYLQTDRGGYFLTLYEKRVREGDLPFFLGLMEHLAARGIACPQPIRRKDGAQWSEINGRPAALVSFLNGLSLRRPEPVHCAAAGAALAKLHAAGSSFALTRPNALGPAGWGELVARTAAGADGVEPGLGALIADAYGDCAASWPDGLPSGVIHADLFPDNVLFMNAAVSGLIDFYFACNDAFAYDLAVMLNAWCFESDGAYNITKGQSVIAAYRQGRELTAGEVEALPLLARGAALRFLLTRLYDRIHHDPAALVRPKDPRDFSRRLRFHLKVRHASEYGL
ncbi:MAG TPA: homoserine kinase [Rhizomicrobium sp.]|jgi:homoserine kinase type II|nr:homoserine kinase [Rhizomicrobium sp.]